MVAPPEVNRQMLLNGFSSRLRVLGVLVIGLACVPAVAFAQADSMTRVERTPTYDVVLSIGPAESGSMAMDSDMADQGMHVNHRLMVRINEADNGSVVSDVTPTIRITDKSTGESRDLPHVMGMSGGMGPNDFDYGQNVFLPDGTYLVTVQVAPSDTAEFRDVMVVASPAMTDPSMGHDMGASHEMGMSHDMGMPEQMSPGH